MNKYKILVSLLSVIFLFLACSKDELGKTAAVISDTGIFSKDYITIGTFNLEWLGDGHRDRKKRSSEDYANIANAIKDIDADILGLQEIENRVAVKKILNYLPEYDFIIGKTGGAQKLAFLYKKSLAIVSYGEYYPIMIEKRCTKAGLWVYVKAGNFDFHLLNVHLKSSSHWDNTPAKAAKSIYLRRSQAKAIVKWADSILTNTAEEDVVILGDFNDSPKKKKNNTLSIISGDTRLIFLSEDLRSCKFRNLYTIDQIVVSDTSSLRFITDSEFMYNTHNAFSKSEVKGISDHCPVTVKFDVSIPDNDPLLEIAFR